MFRIPLFVLLVGTAAFAAPKATTSTAKAAAKPDPLVSFQENDKTLQALLRSVPKEALPTHDPLKQHLGSMFGFGELGKRALGKSWVKQSKADQDSFRVYFARMVQKNALQNPQDYLSDSATNALLGKPSDTTTIHSTVFRGAEKVEITYKLYLDGAAWRVYDLKVGDKPSQLEKYRNQFVQYLKKKSFQELIETVRKSGA